LLIKTSFFDKIDDAVCLSNKSLVEEATEFIKRTSKDFRRSIIAFVPAM